MQAIPSQLQLLSSAVWKVIKVRPETQKFTGWAWMEISVNLKKLSNLKNTDRKDFIKWEPQVPARQHKSPDICVIGVVEWKENETRVKYIQTYIMVYI